MNWTWLLLCLRRRRARKAQAAAEVVQVAERRAAMARILETARRNEGPSWNAPTVPLPRSNRPLMTPAAEYRTRRNRRR